MIADKVLQNTISRRQRGTSSYYVKMASAARKRIADSALVSDADLTCGVNYGILLCMSTRIPRILPATGKKRTAFWDVFRKQQTR